MIKMLKELTDYTLENIFRSLAIFLLKRIIC